MIHRSLPEFAVCEGFGSIFTETHRRLVTYQMQIVACFSKAVFQELCRPLVVRKRATKKQHNAMWERQGPVRNMGGPPANQTRVDHVTPRFIGGEDVLENH